MSELSDPSLTASFTRHPSRGAALLPRRYTFRRMWDATLGSVVRHPLVYMQLCHRALTCHLERDSTSTVVAPLHFCCWPLARR